MLGTFANVAAIIMGGLIGTLLKGDYKNRQNLGSAVIETGALRVARRCLERPEDQQLVTSHHRYGSWRDCR